MTSVQQEWSSPDTYLPQAGKAGLSGAYWSNKFVIEGVRSPVFPPNTISNAETNGYNGLPGIWLKLQEFQNLTIGTGAYYSEINPAWYEVDWQMWF